MRNDPASIISRSPMGLFQIAGIGLCIFLNALDGFDVLSISFASPGISKEWGIGRDTLGVVLSMELIGMAVGSIAIGAMADIIGRRPTVLFSQILMTLGMFGAATAGAVVPLLIYRLLTGFGIGGMLACTNAMTAELANDKYRSSAVAAMAAGYPIGAVLGGIVASTLLDQGTWRSVFVFGGVATALLLPATIILLPESLSFSARRTGPGALEKINKILARMGHERATELPVRVLSAKPITALFRPGLAATTLLLCAIYLCHILTFYYILKWLPKIVTDFGFRASAAGAVLVWANVGGALGAAAVSILCQRFRVLNLVLCLLILASVLVSLFGLVPHQLSPLSWIAAGAGFCTNGAVVGIYALIAQFYPTELRAGGTGFVIGVGRGGAALGPVIAGYLFATGASLETVSIVMALGSLLAAVALVILGNARKIEAAAVLS